VGDPDVERIKAFDHRLARVQASEVVELPWGYAVLQREFPLSEYHNRLVVTSPASAVEVLAAAEEVLGGAGLRHRYVSVDDDAIGRALRADFDAAGYGHETIATMQYAGGAVAPPAHAVQPVSLDALRPAVIRDWRSTLPDATDEHLRQLADRKALYARGAELTLLAVCDGGEIAAHADLLVDRADGIAQFENLDTDVEHRRRGYAGSLLREALRRSLGAGCAVCFLTASLDDWPHDWYQRVGYVDVGRTHHFSRRD
jgi:GNAT superfamily N-acetyltransferase